MRFDSSTALQFRSAKVRPVDRPLAIYTVGKAPHTGLGRLLKVLQVYKDY